MACWGCTSAPLPSRDWLPPTALITPLGEPLAPRASSGACMTMHPTHSCTARLYTATHWRSSRAKVRLHQQMGSLPQRKLAGVHPCCSCHRISASKGDTQCKGLASKHSPAVLQQALQSRRHARANVAPVDAGLHAVPLAMTGGPGWRGEGGSQAHLNCSN